MPKCTIPYPARSTTSGLADAQGVRGNKQEKHAFGKFPCMTSFCIGMLSSAGEHNTKMRVPVWPGAIHAVYGLGFRV